MGSGGRERKHQGPIWLPTLGRQNSEPDKGGVGGRREERKNELSEGEVTSGRIKAGFGNIFSDNNRESLNLTQFS